MLPPQREQFWTVGVKVRTGVWPAGGAAGGTEVACSAASTSNSCACRAASPGSGCQTRAWVEPNSRRPGPPVAGDWAQPASSRLAGGWAQLAGAPATGSVDDRF